MDHARGYGLAAGGLQVCLLAGASPTVRDLTMNDDQTPAPAPSPELPAPPAAVPKLVEMVDDAHLATLRRFEWYRLRPLARPLASTAPRFRRQVLALASTFFSHIFLGFSYIHLGCSCIARGVPYVFIGCS